jgi:hypothetical protein
MINQNLVRWINLSVNTFFDTNKGPYHLLFEGQDIDLDTATVVNPSVSLSTVIPNSPLQTWTELHISTLEIEEVTSGHFESMMTLTLLMSSLYSLDDTLLNTNTGYFANLMTGCIPVKKYGNQGGDDQSLIDSFIPKGRTRIVPWGPVQLNREQGPLKVKQQTVEQLYRLSF